MSDSCFICGEEIVDPESSVRCKGPCNQLYHTSCVNPETGETSGKLDENQKRNWKCDECLMNIPIFSISNNIKNVDCGTHSGVSNSNQESMLPSGSSTLIGGKRKTFLSSILKSEEKEENLSSNNLSIVMYGKPETSLPTILKTFDNQKHMSPNDASIVVGGELKALLGNVVKTIENEEPFSLNGSIAEVEEKPGVSTKLSLSSNSNITIDDKQNPETSISLYGNDNKKSFNLNSFNFSVWKEILKSEFSNFDYNKLFALYDPFLITSETINNETMHEISTHTSICEDLKEHHFSNESSHDNTNDEEVLSSNLNVLKHEVINGDKENLFEIKDVWKYIHSLNNSVQELKELLMQVKMDLDCLKVKVEHILVTHMKENQFYEEQQQIEQSWKLQQYLKRNKVEINLSESEDVNDKVRVVEISNEHLNETDNDVAMDIIGEVFNGSSRIKGSVQNSLSVEDCTFQTIPIYKRPSTIERLPPENLEEYLISFIQWYCENQTPLDNNTLVLEMKGSKAKEISGWGDDAWNTATSAWPEDNFTTQTDGYKRYRALYEFVARNGDELSFQPGDIIMVSLTQNAEPGWLAGELRGASGWFPEAYVECIDLDTGVSLYPEADTVQKTQLEEIAEVPENVSDNGSAVVEAAMAEPVPVVPVMPSLVLGLGTPADLTVVALYPFPASLPGQLPFGKGDIIRVTENQDIWWYGENNGQEGWFPKTYVKLSTDNVNINNTVDTGTLPPDQQEYYVALYPYMSGETGDLSFSQGEVVLVIKKEGEWWTGVIADRAGIFPSNYVQKADTQPVVQPAIEEPVVVPQPQKTQLETQPQVVRAVTPDFSALSSQLESASSGGEDSDSKGTKGKKPEIATVIAPYQATSAEQLSLQRGQLIMIRKKTTTGWWEGELQAKGKKRQIGWFPASYVKTLGAGGGGRGIGRSGRQTPSAEPLSTERVIALYQYKALNEDELSFEKDDIISILSKDEPAWWRGELNGATGLFPSNYVAPVSSSGKKKIKLGKEEKKRQQHIKELIMTEQAYIDDMSIVHDVFEKPLSESKIVTPEELSTIFVNWQDIIVCNYMFLRALRVRREMSEGGVIRMIGDILCENLPRMTVYVRFCSCQLTAAAVLQKLTEESEDFRGLVRRCQTDPRTKGMPLSSFLIKPMQRITKYPLLIQKILEFTPPEHPDHAYLLEALAKAEEFCIQVNEGVREKENSDRLEWLQSHVSCEGLDERIVFNSLTNSVGPRKFIHYGSLTKTKSGKELVGFLLNDFLLLAQPCRPLSQPFSFERHSHVRFKIYKQPLMLSEVVVHTGSETAESVELRLEHMRAMFSLSAASSSDRNLWLRKIQQAQDEVTHSDKCKLQRQQSIRNRHPIGMLRIVVVEVTDVNRNKIRSTGKREVFCEVSMGSQEHRTPPANATMQLDPRWNATMQFLVKDLNEDVLCITVLDRGHFTPDEFLGRTEVRISDILHLSQNSRGPIVKNLPLHEVDSGEVTLKLDLRLFDSQ
ncbi:intersectin-1 isoform X2 [Homalodisca vitripennis]|uniref:intersectin-1 isoform X2 n=1 Tax=Homalodisca vitripennis TaxID=197043 RepID=UPI001EEA2ACD|nr:intersectin-1 isoform X2 [Homalodisca vitripennis]